MLIGLWQREPSAFAFVRNLLVAFIPAVVLGLAFGDDIELLLGNAVVVAWALIIGGFAILIVERLRQADRSRRRRRMSRSSIRSAIGLVQCLAMIPGVSRSGATILGAMAMGVDRKTAAEFSFFLAVPTLTGATALQLYKHGATMAAGHGRLDRARQPRSFVVAVVVVKAFVAIIRATASRPSPGTGSSPGRWRWSGWRRAKPLKALTLQAIIAILRRLAGGSSCVPADRPCPCCWLPVAGGCRAAPDSDSQIPPELTDPAMADKLAQDGSAR